MNVGDFVRYYHSNGSIGKVIDVDRQYDYYHVEWVYGRDKLGEVVKAISRNIPSAQLVKITEIEYAEAVLREFNSAGKESVVVPAKPNDNTGHGHVWPRPDGKRMRCGGPKICAECSKDFAKYEAKP